MGYIATTGEVITENSIPNLDNWGWDDFWTCSDWIAWHQIMKSKKGKEYADSNFLKWWNEQGLGSHALDCRSFNSTFRDYLRKENILENLYGGVGIVAQPIGYTTDIASDLAQGVSTTAKVLKYVLPVASIIAIGIGGYWLYSKIKK
jgi:hypothetical protein